MGKMKLLTVSHRYASYSIKWRMQFPFFSILLGRWWQKLNMKSLMELFYPRKLWWDWVKLTSTNINIYLQKSLLHCHERKALSKTEKLTSLCIHKNSKPAYNDYSLFSKTLAFLKHLELQGWKSKEIGFFLMHSVVHTKKDAAGSRLTFYP